MNIQNQKFRIGDIIKLEKETKEQLSKFIIEELQGNVSPTLVSLFVNDEFEIVSSECVKECNEFKYVYNIKPCEYVDIIIRNEKFSKLLKFAEKRLVLCKARSNVEAWKHIINRR